MIAARRRPLAVAATFVAEAIWAWMLAAPWAETIASAVATHPDGDKALWAPGLTLLYDLQVHLGGALSGLFAASAIGLAVYALLGVFLRGALLAAIADPSRPLRDALARSAGCFFRLLAISAVSLIAAVVVFALLGLVPYYALSARLDAWPPARALTVELMAILVGVLSVAVVFAAADLARARVITTYEGALSAMSETLGAPRAIATQFALSMPRWIASLGLLGWGAMFSTKLHAVLSILVLHQLIAFARVALRASVLARALRLVPAMTQVTAAELAAEDPA